MKMLKHSNFLCLILCGFLSPAWAVEPVMVPLELDANWSEISDVPRSGHPRGWGINSRFNTGECQLLPLDEGYVLELRAADGEDRPFHVFYRDGFIKTAPTGIVEVKVLARGRGELDVLGYLYNADGESLKGLKGENTSPVELNEADFQVLTFRLMLPEPDGKDDPAKLRIALSLAPGGAVLVKSVEAMTNVPQ